jgi:hypothetical protein
MDLPDLTTTQKVAAIVSVLTAVVGILATIFGWCGKAGRWIASRWKRESPGKGKLLFFIDQLQAPMWSSATITGKPGLQIVIRLQASNTTDHPFRIMAARIVGRKALQTNVGIQDLRSNMFGHDYPIPAHQIVDMSVHFILQTPAPEQETKELKGKLEFTDHNARKHRIRFTAHGPKGPA